MNTALAFAAVMVIAGILGGFAWVRLRLMPDSKMKEIYRGGSFSPWLKLFRLLPYSVGLLVILLLLNWLA